MRIAIPLDQGQVAQHMGHCPSYLIAEINEGAVKRTAEVPNPRHGPNGPPPVFLASLGVTHVVGWAAPEHFLGFLTQLKIKPTLGANGKALEVLNAFLNGTLELSTENTRLQCNHGH